MDDSKIEFNSSVSEEILNPEETQVQMRALFEKLMQRNPTSMIIAIENGGSIGCGACGKPVDLYQLADVTPRLIAEQLRRACDPTKGG